MPTTFANTINGNEILAKRAECDYAGQDIQQTYATKSEVTNGLASKQDTISDLATIRSGAQAGATAVQPGDLATVATSGLYSDLSGTPTIPPALSAGNGIDITNDTVSVDLDGTSLTNGANGLSVTLPVPDTTGASQGDVLSVGQSGIEWVTPGGGGDDAVLTYNVSTWSDFTTAYNAGKNIRVVETVDGATYEAVLFEYNPNGSPYGYAKFTATILRTGVGAVSSNWYQISNIDSGVWTRGAGTIQGNFSGQGAISVNSSSHMISLTLDGSSLTQSSSGLAVANPLPSTLGTAGQVLQVNSGATGVEWATPSGGSVTDVEVNGTSVVNASGVAEVTVPSGSDLVPPYSIPADEGKVLTIGPSTTYWATPTVGTVTDVEVDGTSVVSGGVASITMPTVDQTYNSASTNAQSGVAVASAISTKQDTISDLATIRSGAADGATAVQPGDLAPVATSGLYSDLSGTPTINNVPVVTSSDDSKVLKASYTGGVGSYSWEQESGGTVTDVEVDGVSVVSQGVASITMPTVDQTYNSASTNAQSGTAVAGAIAGVNQVPASTSSDEGKVLTVDANGDPEWNTATAPQVQSDWAESDPTATSYIENKPTPKTLSAGTGISITENQSTITVASTAASYTAGAGISISAQNVITNTGVAINKTTPELCGSFMGEPVYTKLYEFTGSVGTSDTTVNFTIDEVVATGSTVTRIWLDPSNSFIEYGSASVKLPLTYFLSSARHGSVFVVSQSAGTLSFRGVDTSSVGLTFFLAVKYTDPTP